MGSYWSSGSSASDPRASVHNVKLKESGDIQVDDKDPVWAIKLGGCCRCKLSRCSTVYFVAVAAKDNVKFPPHCGLLLENDFTITCEGGHQSTTFPYMLVHGLWQTEDTSKLKIDIYFCKSEDAAFQRLIEVHHNYKGGRRVKLERRVSSIACSSVVEHVRTELKRKVVIPSGEMDKTQNNQFFTFDSDKKVKLDENVTNCAMTAVRFFCVLEEKKVKDEAEILLKEILGKLGLNTQFDFYQKMMRQTLSGMA